MNVRISRNQAVGVRSPMIYGQFIEHFHRQIYGGIYDPGNPLSDEDGFRRDVLEAMRRISVPVLRWPGGCFVSACHWHDSVGEKRTPFFDKAWRVEDPATFGTDEYIRLCRKLGCEPYICTNAGTGSAEEMSDWVEYCNLETEGKFARERISNGYSEPYGVKYWSVGNENYGAWEIGAKTSQEWGRLVREACKMMKRVDPEIQLSAAALTDVKWNVNLLECCGDYLDWISIHEYWDMIHQTNDYSDYEQSMAYTEHIDHSIQEVRGLLKAMRLDKRIKIAFDEWNLRGWYHPNIHTVYQGRTKEEYLYPRDLNDDNTKYTIADAVFTACFLNACNQNCDIVGMANFAPVVNTRGCIYTHQEGIVLRSTYYVFELYVRLLGDVVLDTWREEEELLRLTDKTGKAVEVKALDVLVTRFSDSNRVAVAVVNKDPKQEHAIVIEGDCLMGEVVLYTVSGNSTESYNDVGHTEVEIVRKPLGVCRDRFQFLVGPHSVNVITMG